MHQSSILACKVCDLGSCDRTTGVGSWCKHRNPLRTSPRGHIRNRPTIATSAAAGADSFGDNLRRVAKQIQGSLPVIGLISRLMSPVGGVGNDELAYPDFCRAAYEAAMEDFNIACVDLERRHGKPAGRRYLLWVLWASRSAGLVPAKDIISCARRLRATQDMEIEVDRVENARDSATKKYSLMEKPQTKVEDQVDAAVDALCVMAIGLKEGAPVDPVDAELLVKIVSAGFFDSPVSRDVITQAIRTSIDNRATRAKRVVS